jgi:hypothetical protein
MNYPFQIKMQIAWDTKHDVILQVMQTITLKLMANDSKHMVEEFSPTCCSVMLWPVRS